PALPGPASGSGGRGRAPGRGGEAAGRPGIPDGGRGTARRDRTGTGARRARGRAGRVGGLMRVLFTAVGGQPHLYPLVPLAWAFRAAGHEVRFASTPAQVRDIVHIGLPMVAVGSGPKLSRELGDDLAAAMYHQDPWPPGFAGDLSLL